MIGSSTLIFFKKFLARYACSIAIRNASKRRDITKPMVIVSFIFGLQPLPASFQNALKRMD